MSPDALLLSLKIIPLLLCVGALGGFLSGLLGVGGGVIFVPALYFSLSSLGVAEGQVMHVAVGTSLAIVAATVLASSRAHYKFGAVDMSIVKGWGPFLALGVAMGAYLASGMEGRVLTAAFCALTFGIALYMALGREPAENAARSQGRAGIFRALCLPVGAAAALTGIGSAVLTVPFMSLTGVPIQRAVGTGAALGVLVAGTGLVGYIFSGWPHMDILPPLSLGYVNLGIVACAVPPSILIAPYGVHVSHKLGKTALRRLFAAVLALVSVRMAMSL